MENVKILRRGNPGAAGIEAKYEAIDMKRLKNKKESKILSDTLTKEGIVKKDR